MIENSNTNFALVAENMPEWFVSDEQLKVEYLLPTERLAAALIHGPDWYAQGYKAAADKLASEEGADWTERQALIYPIVFLYRHHLELQMKIIIDRACHRVGRKESTHHHELVKLWELCAELLRPYWPDEQAKALDQIGDLIEQFSTIERDATAFRYSERKNGELALSHLWKIDIKYLAGWVARRSDLFDFCIRRLSHRGQK